jgi:hypothetical protein
MATDRILRVPVLGCLLLLTACPGSDAKDEPSDDPDAGEILPDTDAGDEPGLDEHEPAADGGAGSGSNRPDAGGKPAAGNGGSMPSKPGGAAGSGAPGPVAGAEQRFFLPTPEPENTTVPRLEIDRQGGVHAVYPGYAGGNAYYAYCPNNCADPGAMKVVTLPTDGTVGSAMLALTADGKPRVLLPTYLRVYYAECDGQCTEQANWKTSVIVEHASEQDVTGDALAIDSRGRPRFLLHTYLAYLGVGQKAPHTYYAQCETDCTDAASWQIDSIADAIWQNSTLRFDAKDHPHVATALVDMETNTKQLAYLTCDSGCTANAGWSGIGLGTAFEDYTQEIKPAISLALTAAAGPRIVGLSKLETGGRGLLYFECDRGCVESDGWRGTLMSDKAQLGAGLDIAVDANDHPRFVFTLNYNIGLYHCNEADCTAESAEWTLTKVEFSGDLPKDGIILWENCSIDAWVLHDPTLALASDGSVRVGYQATDLSGGITTLDRTKPACIAGKDMTLSRMAMLPAVR